MAEGVQKIKILKMPDVTDLAGEKVMIDFDSGKYFLLSGAANDIWDMLKDGTTLPEIVEKLLTLYEVDRQECVDSTSAFLDKLVQIGFISFDSNVQAGL